MPKSGSQIYLCDLPIRFDTYQGCAHGCKYCFVGMNGRRNISEIKMGESVETLKAFIEGGRTIETNWCDWNIPLHIGGTSDPLQPIEAETGRTYECLKVLRDRQYPFVLSTKGKLLGDEKYMEILSECNAVIQVSIVCEKYDKLEEGCPTFEERLKIVERIAPKVKRVIIRAQPYLHEVKRELIENIERYANAGAYGIVVEGIKLDRKQKGYVKVGGDFVIPLDIIQNDFMDIKDAGHKHGLKVYAGENRLRPLGDSLTCCGIDKLEGFKPNTYNLNHILNGDMTEPTEAMKQTGTASVFRTLNQTTVEANRLKKTNLNDEMLQYYARNKELVLRVFGKIK